MSTKEEMIEVLNSIDYTMLSTRERRNVRNKYCEIQDWKCHFCEGDLREDPPKFITDKKINWKLFPPGFLKYPVHLQHDHKTNMTEGAVHSYCNAVMWQYHGK